MPALGKKSCLSGMDKAANAVWMTMMSLSELQSSLSEWNTVLRAL